MALEQVTVEYNLALEKAKAQFNGLVQTIQQGEQKITNSSKQANNQILSDEQKAHNKRVQFIKEETQDLAELQKRKKLAYSPEEISQYNKRIAETQQRIKTLNGETGNLTKTNGNLITFKNIAAAVGIAFGVQQLLSFGSELLALGQKSKTVTKAFNAIATSSDLGALRASTGFGVTDLQLKQLAVRANMFKISLNTLPSLLKFATIRAAETGQEVDYLVNSIIDGIGRQSPLILDNLATNT
jgi:DNA repair exonuclease SbcCD ATPase subunit